MVAFHIPSIPEYRVMNVVSVTSKHLQFSLGISIKDLKPPQFNERSIISEYLEFSLFNKCPVISHNFITEQAYIKQRVRFSFLLRYLNPVRKEFRIFCFKPIVIKVNSEINFLYHTLGNINNNCFISC